MKFPATAILSLNLFLSGVAFAATAPYRAIVGIDAVGLSNGIFALVMTLSAIGAAAASVVLGLISDRVADRRILVVICAALGIFGFGIVYAVPTPFGYIFAFCVLIPFGNALFSQSFSYARAYYNVTRPDRAEFMMSVLRTLFTVAWVVIPPVAGWLASTADAFAVFALAAVAHAASTLLLGLLFLDPQTKVGVQKSGTALDLLASLPRASISTSHKVGIAGVTFVRIALALHVTVLPLIIIRDFSGTFTDVGFVASVAALLEAPCMIAWGYAAMRMRKETILAANAILYALYLALFLVARSVMDVLYLQVLNAIATAALLSLTISYMQDTIKGRVGLSTSLMDVVTVVSAMSASAVFALFAGENAYVQVFAVGAVLSLAGGVLMGVSRRLMVPDTSETVT